MGFRALQRNSLYSTRKKGFGKKEVFWKIRSFFGKYAFLERKKDIFLREKTCFFGGKKAFLGKSRVFKKILVLGEKSLFGDKKSEFW